MENKNRHLQAKVLRQFRKIHRLTGALLFVFFFLVAITGLLLGWKKNTQGYLLPESKQGISTEKIDWWPIDSLHQRAVQVLLDSVGPHLSPEVDRIDIRPDKGMVKFLFAAHYWEIQLDGTTGQVLQIALRRSDFLEQLHDGSILDRKAGIKGFKLFYTSTMGLALILFTVTGFWLWYGPKRMRKQNRS